MTRLEKLEAVAEAVRDWAKSGRSVPRALYYALAALDADAEAQQMVTLAVWRNDRGALQFAAPGTPEDAPVRTWTRLGTVTLPLDRERGA